MSKSELEVRTGKARPVELRKNDAGGNVLVGYALTYNNYSRDLGGFVEQVAPGAVDKSLADGVRVMARYNHDTILASSDSGTLRMSSDDTGLLYEIDLPDTTVGRDVAALAAAGIVRYSSFAFRTPNGGDTWSFTDQDYPLRTLNSIHLVDVAPVDDPAYFDTSSSLRSLELRSDSSADEIRQAISGEKPDAPAQRETHADTPKLADARRRLALIEAG